MIDYSKYVGSYVKRFYTPFLEKNMMKIYDFRYMKGDKNPRWGDFLCKTLDGKLEGWYDIDDSVIITNENPIVDDERLANTNHEQYKGYNPYDGKEI